MPKADNQELEEAERSLGPAYVPGPHDVVCKRGRKAYIHNEAFRNLLGQHMPSYTRVRRRAEKSCIIMAIVDLVRQRGAFVRYCKKSKCWIDIGDFRSREKVGHSFREILAKGTNSWGIETVNDVRKEQVAAFPEAMAREAQSIGRTCNVANNARELLAVAPVNVINDRGVTIHRVPQLNHEKVVGLGFGVTQTSHQTMGPGFGAAPAIQNLWRPNTREERAPVDNRNNRGATITQDSHRIPQKVGPGLEAAITAREVPKAREERAPVNRKNGGASITRDSQRIPQISANQREAPAAVLSNDTTNNRGATFIRISPTSNAPQRASVNEREAPTVVQSNINNSTLSTPRRKPSKAKKNSKPHTQTTLEETIDNEVRRTTTMTTTTRVTRTETITITTITTRTSNNEVETEEENPQENIHRPTFTPDNGFTSRP